jgi:hypothetical protein
MKQVNIEKYVQDDFIHGETEKWPFTQLSNYVIQNIGDPLSGFLWVYLQSLPPTWCVNKQHIKEHFKIGEHSYQKAMGYLKKCNLVCQFQEKLSGGHYGKSRVIVKNGSKFIHPKDHDKNLSPSINPNVFEGSTSGVKTDLVVKNHDSPLIDFPITGGSVHGESTSIIKKIDIKKKTKNKKTTTTEKKDSSGSSFVDISSLEKYGFSEIHSKQLEKLKIDKELISESISNYVHALKAPIRSQNIVDKVAYFMDVMRNVGFFALPGKRVLTPVEKEVRQQIENNIDDRYGLGF